MASAPNQNVLRLWTWSAFGINWSRSYWLLWQKAALAYTDTFRNSQLTSYNISDWIQGHSMPLIAYNLTFPKCQMVSLKSMWTVQTRLLYIMFLGIFSRESHQTWQRWRCLRHGKVSLRLAPISVRPLPSSHLIISNELASREGTRKGREVGLQISHGTVSAGERESEDGVKHIWCPQITCLFTQNFWTKNPLNCILFIGHFQA